LDPKRNGKSGKLPVLPLRLGSHPALTLVVPTGKTVTFGDRRFEYAAPKLLNDLPSGVRDSSSLCFFKRALKTHYFKQAYE